MLIKHLTPKGFDILHHDRKGKLGGRVAVLFNTVFKAKLDKFLVYTSFEYILVVLQTLNFWVCVLYRPPLLMEFQLEHFLIKLLIYLKYLFLTKQR